MILCYSRRSAPTAHAIADALIEIGEAVEVRNTSNGDINWGRANANTLLNTDTSNVTNKRVMRELFAEHEVPMPKLYPELLHIEPSFPDSLELDGVVIGRSDYHMKGYGFWKCETVGDVRKALRGITYRNGKRKQPATHFMEYIPPELAEREYRVHVFKGKSIRISQKLFSEEGYTTIKPDREVIKHVRKAAKKAMEAVGLDFGAVDVLANDTDCWVLEVNSAPGLGGSMPRLYAQVFKEFMEGEMDD
jgi:hypothetical protein